MGYRAIRICLDRTEIFKTQLRAIYRASYYGTIAINASAADVYMFANDQIADLVDAGALTKLGGDA